MISKERLIAALSCAKTDRVPISTFELVGWNSQAFENNEPSYKRLMDVIREKTDCVCMWEQTSNHVAACSAFHVQTDYRVEKGKHSTDTFLSLHTPQGMLSSSLRVYKNVNTTWHTKRWCETLDDVDAYLSIPFEPLTYNDSDFTRICRELGDNGILMSSVGDPACMAMELMEFGEAMVWAMTETEHFAKTVDEFHSRVMQNLENMLKTRTVDLYRIYGPEYLTPPYLPPAFFSRFVTPYVKDMTRLIQRYGGKVRIHSHGKIRNVLADILSCGADALDPCEAPPNGDITLREIKKQSAGQLCLFGNIQLKTLEHGSVREIREIVKICMEEAKEGGGFVIMPTSAPIDIPISAKTEENYRAFIDAALEYGRY
jgi:uroporphyrinogen-III decarboxylase